MESLSSETAGNFARNCKIYSRPVSWKTHFNKRIYFRRHNAIFVRYSLCKRPEISADSCCPCKINQAFQLKSEATKQILGQLRMLGFHEALILAPVPKPKWLIWPNIIDHSFRSRERPTVKISRRLYNQTTQAFPTYPTHFLEQFRGATQDGCATSRICSIAKFNPHL